MTGVVTLDSRGMSVSFSELLIKERQIVDAYFAEKVVENLTLLPISPTVVKFNKIDHSILGREVYLIVETKNFVPAGIQLTSTERAELKISHIAPVMARNTPPIFNMPDLSTARLQEPLNVLAGLATAH